MRHEKTSPKNPQQLTIQQHYHSRFCISRFLNSDGGIEVFLHKASEIKKLTPDSQLFCAMRMWDQRAEQGFMLAIENSFHDLVTNPLDYNMRNHIAVSHYWALWKLRFEMFYQNHRDDTNLMGISGDKLGKTQEEILEAKNVTFVREGGVIPARFSNGLRIQVGIDMIFASIRDAKWGLLTSNHGEFIVSDNYSELQLLPITPTQAFVAGYKDMHISRESLVNINQESIAASKNLYFARSFANCPIK